MILVITGADEPFADLVVDKLHARGANVVRFDQRDLPTAAEMSVSLRPWRCVLRLGDRVVNLEDVTAVWNHAPARPIPSAHIADANVRAYVSDECLHLLDDMWSMLDCTWLPATTHDVRLAQLKARQLRLAERLGFAVPATVISNSPADFLALYRRCDGRLISKLAEPTAFHRALGADFHRYTERVTPHDAAQAKRVRHCPITFQEYVDKQVELRVTVVGDRAFAAAIHSQTTARTRDDWRRYDHASTPYTAHALPASVATRCVAMVRQLGLRYGALDLVLTSDGRYVFLEVNPAGRCEWIEEATGLPISDALCDELLAQSRARAEAAQ